MSGWEEGSTRIGQGRSFDGNEPDRFQIPHISLEDPFQRVSRNGIVWEKGFKPL